MDGETTVAQGLHTTDDSAGYDAACKRVLSEKAILARIAPFPKKTDRKCGEKVECFSAIQIPGSGSTGASFSLKTRGSNPAQGGMWAHGVIESLQIGKHIVLGSCPGGILL